MYQLYDKNRDRSGTGAKPVKTASFFIKTGFSFVKNGLDNRLRPGCTHHRDDGCGRGADPGLCKAFPWMRGCLSAMPWVFLCLVFASCPANKVVLTQKRSRFIDDHLGLYKCKHPIINHINKPTCKNHDRCMMVE